MHHFIDPSIKPIVVTNIDGQVLYIRTNGLTHYGYPDLYLEGTITDYEMLFYSILDRIYSLDFDVQGVWVFNGRLLRFEVDEVENVARIVFPKADDVRIVTINNPVSEKPVKYMTKGLTELFNHPEAYIAADVPFARGILLHLIEQVAGGEAFDADSYIVYEDYEYSVVPETDRYGDVMLNLRFTEKPKVKPVTQIRAKGSHLRRVK